MGNVKEVGVGLGVEEGKMAWPGKGGAGAVLCYTMLPQLSTQL